MNQELKTFHIHFQRLIKMVIVLILACFIFECGLMFLNKDGFQDTLIITLDTVRVDYLGVYGNNQIKTPWLDFIAKNGTTFREARSPVNVTNPSHSSLFTGLQVRRHGAIGNANRLSKSIVTLAELFNDNNKITAGFISASLLNKSVSGLNQGFDVYKEVPVKKITRRSDHTIRFFLDWFGQQVPGDFFAWLHLYDAHAPYRSPTPYNKLYYYASNGKKKDKTLPSIPLSESLKKYMKNGFIEWLWDTSDPLFPKTQYMGEISFMDAHVGKLIHSLKKKNRLYTTLIVITSDHGESLGEHGYYYIHSTVNEPDLRIPLIFFPRTLLKSVSIVNGEVGLIDIVPTVVELARLNVPTKVKKSWDGRSLKPAMVNKKGVFITDTSFIAEHEGLTETILIKNGWKFKKIHTDKQNIYPAGTEFLYNIIQDPTEKDNRLDMEKPIARKFRKDLRKWLQDVKVVGSTEVGTDTMKILRALQYVR